MVKKVKEKKDKTITLRLKESFYNDIVKVANNKGGLTASALIRLAIAEYINKNKKQPTKK